MLSITDLRDFIDLDVETVRAVEAATDLPEALCTTLARQLLNSENGLTILHHMFRDQIAEADPRGHVRQELERAYAYFSRKYPLPGFDYQPERQLAAA